MRTKYLYMALICLELLLVIICVASYDAGYTGMLIVHGILGCINLGVLLNLRKKVKEENDNYYGRNGRNY